MTRAVMVSAAACLFLSLAGLSLVAEAGPLSSIGKESLKKVLTLVVKKQKIGTPEIAQLTRSRPDLGPAFRAAFEGRSPAEIARVSRHLTNAQVVSRLNADDVAPAVRFLADTGRPGYLVLKRFGWQGAAQRRLTQPDARGVAREAGKLIGRRIDGSWVRLRQALTDAKFNKFERDIAEELFLDRAKAGRMLGMDGVGKNIWSAHRIGPQGSPVRQGLDFIAVHNGRIRIIEFSTARKPSGQGIPPQMSWEWIEPRLQKFLKDLPNDQVKRFRDAGFPEELLARPELATGERLRGLANREFFAVERDIGRLRKLGSDIKFWCLEEYRGCANVPMEAS